MLRHYEVRDKKLTIPNENGYMKLMGVYAIGMATQPTALGIFDFGKGNSFGHTLIYESESSIGMN